MRCSSGWWVQEGRFWGKSGSMIDQVGTITDTDTSQHWKTMWQRRFSELRASWIVTRVTGLEEGCFMEVSYRHTRFRVSMINM